MNGGFNWRTPPYRETNRVPSQFSNFGILMYLLNERARLETGLSQMFVMGPNGSIQLSPQAQGAVGFMATTNISAMVQSTVAAAQDHAIDALTILASVLAEELETSGRVLQANRVLAGHMRTAMVNSYVAKVETRRQVPRGGHPRRNRLSGHLKKALQNPDMVVATSKGINYVNQDRLNIEARHWQRINFGVQPASTPAPKQYELLGSRRRQYNYKGGNVRSAGTLGFKNKGPRPPMFLPPGFWTFIGGRIDKQGRDVSTNFEAPANMGRRLDFEERRKSPAEVLAERRARRAAGTLGDSSLSRAEQNVELISSFKIVTRGRDRKWGRNYGPLKRRSGALKGRAGGIRKSQQMFSPTRKGPMVPTKGVVGVNFLDAGFKALSDHADTVYFGMAREILNDGSVEAANKKAHKLIQRYKPLMELEDFFQTRRAVRDRRWLLERIEQAARRKTEGGRQVYREVQDDD